MYRRIRNQYCKGILILALALRLLTEPGVTLSLVHGLEQLRSDPGFISAMFYLGSGWTVTVPTGEKTPGTVTLIHPQQPETVSASGSPDCSAEPFDFSLANAEAIPVSGSCTYSYDKQALLEQPIHVELSETGPKILIVHTHGCEAYTPSEGWAYEAEGAFRTSDLTRNVNVVGSAMAEAFSAAGIETLHLTGCNDADGFTGAYDRMAERISAELEAHPSICMVLDIHRDAYDNADGSPAGPVCTTDEGEAARVMLVMGSDEGGLYHPRWQDNLSCALKVQALLEQDSPGICRTMLLRQSRYNQHLTPCSLLVEVGSTGNTMPEAIVAGRKLAEAIVRLFEQPEIFSA